ncbi:MAG: glucose-1-phosphate adenylyltransferase subunit GlgD [Clostridia bacterium]|nr:glucose-1-phosphate adenylyltransferase subunit GlgD [Clostridia bacterium]
MAATAVGVVFSHTHEENVPELVHRRTMASIPYGGRYRIIDFALSNMVNSGITTVGLSANNNYRSLVDHIGSGKDWDLARKDGGLILLPPFSENSEMYDNTRMEAIASLTGFLTRRNEKYVVLYDCDAVAKFDISDIINAHEKKDADITIVTRKGIVEKTHDYLLVDADESGRIYEAKKVDRGITKGEATVSLGIMVFNRKFLLNLVNDSIAHGFRSFSKDVIIKQLSNLRIFSYNFEGYYAGIDSVSAYFKHNMELLQKDVRDELFSGRDIYTKVRDSAPSKYGAEAEVKNSLVSDGCEIEGTVENSILFRGVRVGKGSVVRNSIVMQDSVISEGASIDCVITDKNVVITSKRHLAGCESLPYIIQKGKHL